MLTLRSFCVLLAFQAIFVKRGESSLYVEIKPTEGVTQVYKLDETFDYNVEVQLENPGKYRAEVKLPRSLPKITTQINSIRIYKRIQRIQRNGMFQKWLETLQNDPSQLEETILELISGKGIWAQPFVYFPFPKNEGDGLKLLRAAGSKVMALLNKGDNADADVPQTIEVAFFLRVAKVNGADYVLRPPLLDNYKSYDTLLLPEDDTAYNLAECGKPTEYLHFCKQAWGDCNVQVVNRPCVYTPLPLGNNLGLTYFIKGGTTDVLLEYILDNLKAKKGTMAEKDVKAFLFTHTAFMNIQALLDKLLALYSMENGEGGSYQMKRNVLEFVLLWLQSIKDPAFAHPSTKTFLKELSKKVERLPETKKAENENEISSIACTMSKINSLMETYATKKSNDITVPPLITPANDTDDKGTYEELIKFDVIDLAHQLTKFLCKPFALIRMYEIVEKIFVKETLYPMPNLKNYVNYTVLISNWVTKQISSTENITQAAKLIELFINVAHKCKETYRDMNIVFAIVLGLEHTAVTRLTNVWARVPATVMSKLENLKPVASLDRNAPVYRELIATFHEPPFTPKFNTILGDLIFIRCGYDPVLYKNKNIINFERMRLINQVLEVVRLAQQSGVNVSEKGQQNRKTEEPIQTYLSNLRCFEENQNIHEKSNRLQVQSLGNAKENPQKPVFANYLVDLFAVGDLPVQNQVVALNLNFSLLNVLKKCDHSSDKTI